ncbi:MAG: diphthine synthase [Candidatus Pacearchaeota archaeon]|nr:diphthine synthase [Candidatus Pacearchaeota archaeon]
MLYLIGLGLDLNDLSLKAIERIERSKKVYIEAYTIGFPYSLKELEEFLFKIVGKRIEISIANRELMENKLNKILMEAKMVDTSILVYGDPLAATTHMTVLKEARKLRLKTEVLHNASVFNAISQTGLQLYKFGKTTSIPKWQDNFKPTSFFDIIKENLSIKAHSLVLVDIGLSLKETIKELNEASQGELIDKNIVIMSRGGTKNQKIFYGNMKDIVSNIEKGKIEAEEPFCLIIPSEMHFSEEEMLKEFLI